MDKKDKSDQIRVIDDGEEVKEVVRLDAPKRVTLEKKELSSEERVIPTMMGEGEKVEEVRAETLDPEKLWLEEMEEQEVRSVPMGWFVILGLALAGVLIWVANYNLTSQEPGEDDGEVSALGAGAGGLSLTRMEEIEKEEKALAHFMAMENLLRDFLKADTIEERLRYVRDPDRIRPLMEDHYSREELKSYEYDTVSEYHVVSLNSFPFLALKVDVKGGDFVPVLVDDNPKGMKVDWESFVCYQPMEEEEFVKNKVVEPTNFRVHVKRDVFYAFDFADEKKFACFSLSFRNSDETLFGYVERETQLYKKFQKLFPDEDSNVKTKSLILSLAFEPGSRAPKSVRIHDLLSDIWAYPPEISNEDSEEK